MRRNSMKKKFTAILMALSVLISVLNITAFAADTVYTYTDTSDLSKGITITNYNMLMSDYSWVKAQVARVDLNYPHLALKVFGDSRGTHYLNTVKNLAAQNDTIVAVNSDFFAWDSKPGRGSAVGVTYIDDIMYSTPDTKEGGLYALLQDTNGNVLVDIFNYSMTLVAPNGNTCPIRGLNKGDDLSGIMMYNKYWNSESLGSAAYRHEMVVRNGIVEELRYDSAPVVFDDDTYVLTTLSDWNRFLMENFQPGDPVRIDVTSSIDFSGLKMAAGGGARILNNGTVPTTFSHNISGVHPRTAAGVDASGKILYLVTVEGRINTSRGMSLTELGNFMKQIGAHNAINLDGGGSTTMIAKNPASGEQELKNVLSDGSARSIATAIGIKADIPQDDTVAHITIKPDGGEAWVGSSKGLDVSGTNQYFIPKNIDPSQITWNTSGVDGYTEHNRFYPRSAGMATITAYYGNTSSSVQIRVLDKPRSVEGCPAELSLQVGESRDIWPTVRDENGYAGYVPLGEMIVTATNDVVSVNGTAVTANRAGTAVLNVAYGDASANIAVSVGGAAMPQRPDNREVRDSRDKTGTPISDANKSLRIGMFGTLRAPDTLFAGLIASRAISGIAEVSDIGAFLSVKNTEYISDNLGIPIMTCAKYGRSIEKGNTVIRLDSEDYFMSMNEWSWFLSALDMLETKNVIIMLNTGINFKASWETALFKNVLADTAAKGYNIYVFHNGAGNSVQAQDGVRYISVGGLAEDITVGNFVANVSRLQYLLVDIDNNGELNYRYVPLYN